MANNRKPAHLEYQGGKNPRQRIWEVLRKWRNGITLSGLVGELPGTIHRDTTRSYVKALHTAGFLELDRAGVYKLVKDNGVEAPRVRKDGSVIVTGTGQENMWRVLRNAGRPVSYIELAVFASTEHTTVAPATARDYIANLLNAGYLNKLGDKVVLIPSKNTGPRPPMIQRIKQVYDPNIGKVVWTERKEDGDE